MQRRRAIALLSRSTLAGFGALALSACGFKLRGAQNYAFKTLAVLPQPGGALAQELRRSFDASVRVLPPGEALTQAQMVLDIVQEQREKSVVGVNSSGQVREFQLRGSLAALRISVCPWLTAAAIRMCSVPVTEGSSKNSSAPVSRPGTEKS